MGQNRRVIRIAIPLALCLASLAVAQTSAKPPSSPEQQIAKAGTLAERGHCAEALPLLKRAVPLAAGKDVKKRLEVDGLRCAMTINGMEDALEFVRLLNRDSPRDPDVLYMMAHVFSDLSIRASEALLYMAPSSYQVHELNAEAMETQGKWDEAASEYRVILAQNPDLPGIHYRLGRVLLSRPKTDTSLNEAAAEFEKEVKVNPDNPGAEYVLGEIARQAEHWPQAIDHFSRSAKLDVSFADAFIGLGRSLIAAGKMADAIGPLERAAKLQPPNPTPHYFLAIAYRRTGRKADAEREAAAHKQSSEKARATAQEIQLGVLGPQRVDPKELQQQP